MAEESLEEMAERLSKSTVLQRNIPLRELKQKVLSVVKLFDPNAYVSDSENKHSHGLTVYYVIQEICIRKIPLCKQQKGTEKKASWGVVRQTITSLSEDLKIPELLLHVYLRGTGKHLRDYERRFENAYRRY